MNLKEKFQKKNSHCIGTFLKLPRPEVVDILASAGFDFAICDMEHAQITENEAREVIRAGVADDLPIVVRLPDATQGIVNRLLEAGAAGIQIPRLRSAKDIQKLKSVIKFPPFGTRSVGIANQSAEYGAVPLVDYLEKENNRVITIGQFETKAIDEPCDPMFDGLDVAFIGPTDLCVDYGVPGNINDERVQERLRVVEETAKKTGTILGAFAATEEDVKFYMERGYRFLAVSGDISFLAKGARKLIKDLHDIEGK